MGDFLNETAPFIPSSSYKGFKQTHKRKVMKKITILMLLFCCFFINDTTAACFQGEETECNNQGPYYIGIMGGIAVLDINMKNHTQDDIAPKLGPI